MVITRKDINPKKPDKDEEEVDNRVDQWHTMTEEEFTRSGEPDLHTFLGWTWEEYSHWVGGS